MIEQYISEKYQDASSLKEKYTSNLPFPHIVMPDFFQEDVLSKVVDQFPDLKNSDPNLTHRFNNQLEIKFASRGIDLLSPAAYDLISFLNSEYFLRYLQELTGIEEKLLSDPYLSGGGYHEIKRGGLLKIHADFNKHPSIDIDRRLNILIYLNKDWEEEWGGDLQLFNEDMTGPVVRAYPHFNTCVIFSTTSNTFHGHPDPVMCPDNKSRRSLALYYFSVGRPESETNDKHSTVFKLRENDALKPEKKVTLKDFVPPILVRAIKKLREKEKR